MRDWSHDCSHNRKSGQIHVKTGLVLADKRNSVPPTLFPHLTDGEKECTPHSFPPPYRWGKTVYPSLFFPTLQMGRKSVPLTYFPHLTDGEKQCTPHSFSPPYRWGERVYPSLIFPTLLMGKNSVPSTLFPHLTDGEKEWTTLFFPFSTVEI